MAVVWTGRQRPPAPKAGVFWCAVCKLLPNGSRLAPALCWVCARLKALARIDARRDCAGMDRED
jgi:hypothetical protein